MIQTRTLPVFLLSLGLSISSSLFADGLGPVITDRPDQTESAATVPFGYWQVETGISLARDEEEGFEFEELNVGNTLVRVGLSDRVELRVGWDGYLDTSVTGPFNFDADGVGDANLGFKLNLREGDETSPAVAVIVTTSVPVGDAPYSAEAWDPSLRLTVAHELTDRVGLGWNVGVERESTEAGDFSDTETVAFFTAVLAFSLNERLGLFTEIYGDSAWDELGDPTLQFDAGFTYLLRDHLQLDLAAGIGLEGDALDHFVGAGVSIRIPD